MTSLVRYCRSLLFYVGYVLSVFFGTLFCFLLVLIVPESKSHLVYQAWCRFVLAWFRLCCNVRIDIQGLENIPGEPVVILANHQSEWETIFVYRHFSPVCPILKKELLDLPFYGWAMRLLKPIAIDRSKPREAGKMVMAQGAARLRSGRSVIIFPEGTRSPAGQVRPFSRGGAKLALAAGVPILPIAHDAGSCWPARKFLKFPGVITAIIGKPVQTSGRSAAEVTEEVETWVRQHVVVMPPETPSGTG